jgi:hypothetical protein
MDEAKPPSASPKRAGCLVPTIGLVCGAIGFVLGMLFGPGVLATTKGMLASGAATPGTLTPSVPPAKGAPQEAAPTAVTANAAVPVPTHTTSGDPCQHNLAFARDVTVPDDTQLEPGAAFEKTWAVRNAGNCAWAQPLVLKFVAGEQMGAPDSVPVPPAKPGEACEVSVPMQAPQGAGTHSSGWRLCAGDECYGSTIYARIVTKAPAGAP